MSSPRATTPPPVPPKTIWSADRTLRDEFAMAALPANIQEGRLFKDIAEQAYRLADAMLEARDANR